MDKDKLYQERFGKYVKDKLKSRNNSMTGISKKMSIPEFSKEVGVSKVWMYEIIKGNKKASDENIVNISRALELDEVESFKVAGRFHPDDLEEYRKKYLKEYYL